MLVELVRCETSDGVRLDGALHAADSDDKPAPCDAVLMLHGVGGNFYGSSLLAALTPGFQQRGVAVLWANTRGHDGVSYGKGRRLGAAYEVVDYCRHDIAAWLGLLQEKGHRRIALFGHSLGAIKSAYATASERFEAVSHVIAASPPRLAYKQFLDSPRRDDFLASMQAAEAEVAAGREQALIEVRFPFPMLIAAGCYVEKYGPEERYDILKFARRLPCPSLFVYGQIELEQGGVAFANLPELIAQARGNGVSPVTKTVLGADHFYSGVYPSLAEVVFEWLEEQAQAEKP